MLDLHSKSLTKWFECVLASLGSHMSRVDINEVEKQTIVLMFSRIGRLSIVDHSRQILEWVEERKT